MNEHSKTVPMLVPGLLLLASIAILGGAFAFQQLGVMPCKLCYYQRYAHVFAIAFSLTALILVQRGGAGAWPANIVRLSGLAFLGGAGIALYHTGVELHWWQGPASCTGLVELPDDPDAALAILEATPVVRCDEIPWSLFGLSLTNYNAFMSLALAAFALVPGLWRFVERRTA